MKKLTESAIRPPEFIENQKKFLRVDLGRLLSRYEEFVFVPCPACGEGEYTAKFEHNGIHYVECESCETLYVNPRPPSDVLGWFYQDSPNYAYWNSVIFPASEEIRRANIFVPRVDRLIELCSKYEVETNSLLEIGSGFGTFCEEVKTRNIFERIVAVEPSANLAKTCRGKGIEVIEKPVEQIQLGSEDLFDVIANFEVIEHLFAPAEFVEAAVRLLKPGGILMLACPNGQGFDVETLGVLSDTVDHEHLNYFNQKSIGILLESAGLEVLESSTPGVLDADLVRNKILSGEFDASNQPFLQKVLVDEWDRLGGPFQHFLVEQGLSSNMWVVARKV